MNKQELITFIADNQNLTKVNVTLVIDCMMTTIKNEINKGNSVKLSGFGTFQGFKAKERTARNPKTQRTMKLKETTRVRFITSDLFLNQLNNRQNE